MFCRRWNAAKPISCAPMTAISMTRRCCHTARRAGSKCAPKALCWSGLKRKLSATPEHSSSRGRGAASGQFRAMEYGTDGDSGIPGNVDSASYGFCWSCKCTNPSLSCCSRAGLVLGNAVQSADSTTAVCGNPPECGATLPRYEARGSVRPFGRVVGRSYKAHIDPPAPATLGRPETALR